MYGCPAKGRFGNYGVGQNPFEPVGVKGSGQDCMGYVDADKALPNGEAEAGNLRVSRGVVHLNLRKYAVKT